MSSSVLVLQPLRLPNFALFWTAQALSKLGDPITLIALATISYKLTGSALLTALAVLVTLLPSAIFGFAAGAISDAVGPRRTMVWCDVARAALVATIPLLLVVARAPLWTVFLIAFAVGTFTAIFNPARVAMVPLLIRREDLGPGNSLVFATDRTVEILGLVVAGLLVATLQAGALYVDAATFAVSAVLLSRIRIEDPPVTRVSPRRVFRDAAAGVAFLGSVSVLRANTIFSLVAQLSLPIYNGLLPVLIFRRFASGDADLGAGLFGLAEAAFALGAVVAALALPQYIGRIRKGRLITAGFAGFGAVLLLVASTTAYPVLIALVALGGILNMVFFVPTVTLAQEVTAPEMQGRVFGARAALLSLSWLPVALVAGTLADVFDVGVLIAGAGLLTLTTAAVGALLPSIRDVP